MSAPLRQGKGLNERMVLLVDRASKTTFVRAAKKRGMTVSALMRERMVGAAAGEATDVDAIVEQVNQEYVRLIGLVEAESEATREFTRKMIARRVERDRVRAIAERELFGDVAADLIAADEASLQCSE